jgi:hypothetical protein
MHVEKRGGLLQIQRVHNSVESRMDGLLFPESHDVEPAQGGRAVRGRGVAEAIAVEVSAWAHIHARNVASAAIAVA